MEYTASEFWWKNITGPQVLVSDVADILVENEIVALTVPSDLPWRHEMRAATQEAFQERSDDEDAVIYPIDIVDDDPEDLDPGKFILKKFASSEVQRGYRERSRHSIQDYINAKKVLTNRIIWVKGLGGKKAEEWLSFCGGFSQTSIETGLFVLEIHGNIDATDYSNVKNIDFNTYVSQYDVQLFDSFILDSKEEYTDTWKNYVSAIASVLCNTDAEVSEELIEKVDFRTQSVLEGLSEIAGSKKFDRRGREDNSNHVLKCIRNNNMDVVNYRIWKAQVQVLFPVIEIERIKIIEKYRESIQKAIDNNTILQYGEPILKADEAELGTLCFMMSRRNDQGYRLLYIPEEDIREHIRFLHDCRNKLAHVSYCTPEEVARLLGQ